MEYLTVASCVTTCLTVYAISKIITYLVRRRLLQKRFSKLRGPASLPFVGSAYLFFGSTEVILSRIIELLRSYPSPFPVWIGNHLIFCITTPDDVKAVCRSDKTLGRTDFLDFSEPFMGTGLFTAPVEKWQVHRQIIQPTFRMKNLQSFVEIFAAESESMVKDMERNLDGPEFEILENYIAKYSLNTICETTTGVRLRAQTNGNRYAETVKKVMSSVVKRVCRPWLHPDFIFYRTLLGKAQQGYFKYLNDFADNIIQSKKNEHLQRRSQSGAAADDKDDKCNSEPRQVAILDHLIELSRENKTLSDKALRDEVNTMIAAGSDTFGIASSFAMLMLASHPEIQEKAYQELCEIYGEDDSQELRVRQDDLTRMQYLERVVKETIRLFPIAPLIVRATVDDFDIGDATLPKGSSIFLGIVELHRNENYWPDPMKFDPDRFLPEKVAERHPFAYLPFGGGIRGCIGSKYAMMSVKTLLATVLRRYVLIKDDIIPVKDFRLKYEFLLGPSDPIMLRIEKRTQNGTSIRVKCGSST